MSVPINSSSSEEARPFLGDSVNTDSKDNIQFFAEALHKAYVSFKCHLILYNGARSGFEEADRLFALLSAEG